MTVSLHWSRKYFLPLVFYCFNVLLLTLAALMSSSAKHSAMVLMLRNADSRAPVQSSQIAWFTRRSGDTSTAWRRTVPARPIRVESSRGPLLMMALTTTCRGFCNQQQIISLRPLCSGGSKKGWNCQSSQKTFLATSPVGLVTDQAD